MLRLRPDDTSNAPLPRKTTQLRRLLQSNRLEFILEAHNGLSARIVEEAGFKGIWGSGLALSAQFGVRDNNEASWTQIVDMLEFMADATSIPILLDGDTGYGNFNNMRRLVHKLEQRDIAGVCIEDKVFPKTNSFIGGERQPLADIAEFCGKIKAGKDSQQDDDFSIVARVEALIAGWDVAEALRRAEAYHAAGADAILIHSKLSSPDEILAFAREWAGRSPLVIVPTKYYSTATEVFRSAGIDLVIWANQMLRTSITAMQDLATQVYANESLVEVEERIAPVNEVFRLQGAAELSQAEQRYFNDHTRHTGAVILAASRGKALQSLTEDRPKAMLPVAGKPLLRRLVDEFKNQHINEISVVAGYRAEAIDVPGIQIAMNEAYRTTGELGSLLCARNHFQRDTIVLYGDLLFRSYILADLLDTDGDIIAVVDSAMHDTPVSGTPDYAWCSAADDRALFRQDVTLHRITDHRDGVEPPCGRWIGIVRVRGAGNEQFLDALQTLSTQDDFNALGIPDLLNHLVAQGHPVKVLYIHGHWLDVNNLDDLERAGDFAHGHRNADT